MTHEEDAPEGKEDKSEKKPPIQLTSEQKARIQHAHARLGEALEAVHADDEKAAVDEAVKELVE